MMAKVNIINTWCIPMSEAVTMPSLMTMTLIVSEESLARNTYMYTLDSHTQTHFALVYRKLFLKENKMVACKILETTDQL